MRSLDLLVRSGFAPLLPDAVKIPIRQTRAKVREVRGDRDSWLAPAMQRLLRDRRERHRRPDDDRTPREAQRRLTHMLSNAYHSHARDSEEGLAAGCGIELRRPFYARELVEFAFATPDHVKVAGLTGKRLHRIAMHGYLPEAIRNRETKAEFVVTFLRQLPELGRELARSAGPANAGWVHRERIADLYARIGAPDARDAPERKIWSLFGCHALSADGWLAARAFETVETD